jgi:hypothetical protein
MWIPLTSTFIALLAVGSSMYVQRQASVDQRALKEYELGFRPKVEGYGRLMQAVYALFQHTTDPIDPGFVSAYDNLHLTAIQLEPMVKDSLRPRFNNDLQLFIEFCLDARRRTRLPSKLSDDDIGRFLEKRDALRKSLYQGLFDKE